MHVEICPLAAWEGMDFQSVLDRVIAIKAGQAPQDAQDKELNLVRDDFFWIADEADFMLQMLRSFDTQLSWCTTTANRDPKKVRKLIMDPLLLPGFNDSGAHLTNMAFYDVNLRCLKLAAEGGDDDVSYMVKRLTKDAADVFGVAGGTINIGDQADVILIDPQQLNQYEGEAKVERVFREEYQHQQLVNRSNNVVPLVLINGHTAWKDNAFGEGLGKVKMGSLLKKQRGNQTAAQEEFATV
jgi:N-acyl-D-aspartate/D-glutamate deacylase